MYNVSNAYKQAMKSPVQRARMTGTVNGVSFGDSNILRGSFSITNQCSGNSNVEIGQVYIGQLQVTLVGMDFARNELSNKVISPIYGRLLGNGSYEDVPLGVYNIGEANRTASGIVIKAFDNMKKLDKSCGVTSANGTPFVLAKMACNACRVTLGTTEAEFASFANGNKRLSMFSENDIETWRDFVSWLSAACGTFVYADRNGQIRFKQYNTNIVDTIDDKHRLQGASFSDFTTRYTGISCVNIKEMTTSYYGLRIDDGLTYNLGSNPFLQYGVEAEKEELRRNVLNAITAINYIPFTASMVGDPSYDLGDVIQFRDGIAPSSGMSCITYYSFNYNGIYKAKGVGENPDLSTARSKSDKNIAGLMSNIKDSGVHYSQYINADPIAVGDGQRLPIINHSFAVNEKGHVSIDMQLCFDTSSTELETSTSYVENDTVVTISYTYDGEPVNVEIPVETYQDSKHVIRLRHDIESSEAMIHRWVVYLEANGGSVYIPTMNALSVIMGNGLAGDAEWDGTIQAEDYVETFNIDSILRRFNDKGVAGLVSVKNNNNFTDTIARYGVASAFMSITDSASVSLKNE